MTKKLTNKTRIVCDALGSGVPEGPVSADEAEEESGSGSEPGPG